MKTCVYIDGFNLYYSALRGTSYKWLDVLKLFENICHQQDPASEIVKVKFFTAPIKAKISTRKQQAVQSQRLYIKALQSLYPERLDVIEGYFQLSKGSFPKYQHPIDKKDKAYVWRLEEKKTDVNLALNLYRDANKGHYDQIVLVSNDSDIIPALEYIHEDFPGIKIGTIFPKMTKGQYEVRPTNKELSNLSHWTRQYMREQELIEAQLPEMIPTKKKPIYKPSYW